jgi:hypothetical protein
MMKKAPSLIQGSSHKTYGVIYDVGDFPREDLINAFPDANLIIGHIILFEDYKRLLDFLNEATKSDDINSVFSTLYSKFEAIGKLQSFESAKRETYHKEITCYLEKNLDALVENLY